MSGREWKPGDVALVQASSFDRVVVGLRSGVSSNMGWAYGGTGAIGDYGNCWRSDPEGKAVVRPLAVIDPDSPKDQRRILDLLRNSGAFRGVVSQDIALDCIGDALREFANPTPPKPDEPQGLYARVEDAEGRIWVRTAEQASVWRREAVNSAAKRYLIPQDGCEDYADISAIRVLSEGVPS